MQLCVHQGVIEKVDDSQTILAVTFVDINCSVSSILHELACLISLLEIARGIDIANVVFGVDEILIQLFS
jgi:hypothetical protein